MYVMDLKGITWAGNIYEKFEAMGLEVEEVMYQDTVRYLENQVEAVYSCVKKFYSEVMEDILPPDYLDPVKVVDADLPLNPHFPTKVFEKPKVTMKLDWEIMKKKNIEDYKVVGGISAENKESVAKLHYTIDHAKEILGEATSFCQLRKESGTCSASDGVCDVKEARFVHNSVCTSTARVDSPASGVNLSSDVKEPNLEISPQTSDTDSDSKKPARMESKPDTICGSVPYEAYFVSEGRSDKSKIDALSNDIGLEIIERLDESKCEDTCVLVEGNELQVVPQKKGKPNSYKKKFQEAFPLRRKSTRKQEYEKLASQYSANLSKDEVIEQHSEDVSDSKWELLSAP